MLGLTHGNRSPVTCRLRCGDACAKPVPNTSENQHFRDIASKALSRRALFGGAAAVGLAAGLPPVLGADPLASADGGRGAGLRFEPITPVTGTLDDMAVPRGYAWQPIIRWGDPVLRGAPEFDGSAQTGAAQAGQFGYNCDYLNIIVTNGRGTEALLVANHEYTNEELMFPPDLDPAEAIRIAWAAHGMSVVELERRRKRTRWTYRRGARLNRRFTLETPFSFDGPAAGCDLLTTDEDPTGTTARGTLNNCSGGTTPWGTVLSGEENFNQYFLAEGTPRDARYGLGPDGDHRNWRSLDPRWNATDPGYANEPNRFGWIVEIDPHDPNSTPVKHTAMGRFKHEGANVAVARDGRVVAYMGDDERFEYVYRFVSRHAYRKGNSAAARRHNLRLLSEGDLSVARFTGDGAQDGISDGTGEWIPLTRNGRSMVPGWSIEEVLVYTRLAADRVQPTKMDRPEDVEPNLVNGRVYVACTNNIDRGKPGKEAATEPNPRNANKDGHVVEIAPSRGDHTARSFDWNLLLICGDPATAGTYFGGYTGPVSPIACPDNVAFDSTGTLWVSTDGQAGSIGYNDALHRVTLSGRERGKVEQFLSVPVGAETCGPVIHDKDGSVFVAVQHPGENGTWAEPLSYFPDYVMPGERGRRGDFSGPRPTVIQVTRH